MITFSSFCRHWAGLKGRVNAADHRRIGREALDRVHARYREGRASTVLCFADLSGRLEALCTA